MNLDYEPIYYIANAYAVICIIFAFFNLIAYVSACYEKRETSKSLFFIIVFVLTSVVSSIESAAAKWHMENDNKINVEVNKEK